MLAEFALIPCVFDEQANPDKEAWLEQLTHLGANMFPRMEATSGVVVSNLYSGSWHRHALQVAEAVKHPAAKRRCQDILTQAKDVLVDRPAVSDWPWDDTAWAREAISSCKDEPIERIVASAETREKLRSEGTRLRTINEVLDSGFWHGLGPGLLRARIDDQVMALRKVCLHSHFLCLITPYIFGGGNDEADFALELIKKTTDRPKGFSSPVIEIHAMFEIPPTERERWKRQACGIAKYFQKSLQSSQLVKLVLWPRVKDKDRRIIAGVVTEDSAGRRLRSPRWAISMTHVAYANEATEYSHFNLMSRDELDLWFNKYCREGVQGYSLAGTISQSGFEEESIRPGPEPVAGGNFR